MHETRERRDKRASIRTDHADLYQRLSQKLRLSDPPGQGIGAGGTRIAVIDALRARFPLTKGPRHDDICYATQNRQDAVRKLGQQCDLVLVVGSPNSSNSNRLRELAQKQGVPAHLIDGADDIDRAWLVGKSRIGVTAGASAPECLVEEVIEFLRGQGFQNVKELEVMPENVRFGLPPEIVEAIAAAPAIAGE